MRRCGSISNLKLTSPAEQRTKSSHLDLDGITLDTYRECFDIAGDRRTEPFASLRLEATAVKGAFNDITLQPAVAKQGMGMRAYVVGRVELDHRYCIMRCQHRRL